MQGIAEARPSSRRSRRRTLPRGLGACLAAVAIVGIAWALLVPPWQSPDELAHYGYAQSLAEGFALPGTPGRPATSSDVNVADAAVGASRGAFFPRFSPPDWSGTDAAAYRSHVQVPVPPSRTDGSGPSSATGNPPLYYLFAALGSRIDHGGTAFGRLYTTRLLGLLLLLLTTLGAWLLAGEVFARRRLAQVTCALTVGLWPMATFMSTNVNPDAMLMTTWTWALWHGARVINRQAATRDVVALLAVTAAAILAKATSYALVVPVLVAIGIGWRRQPAERRRGTRGWLAASLLVLAVPVLGWVALAHSLGGTTITNVSSGGHAFNVRQFLSYVWQFYLPRLPFLTPFRTTPGLPVYDIWVHEGIGLFGWTDVSLPSWVYPVARIPATALAVAVVVLLARRRRAGAGAVLAFLGLTLVALLALLHITEYRVLIGGGGQFVQGRYLLPVVAMLGLSFALLVNRLPRRLAVAACSLILIGLIVLQGLSLSSIVKGYYL